MILDTFWSILATDDQNKRLFWPPIDFGHRVTKIIVHFGHFSWILATAFWPLYATFWPLTNYFGHSHENFDHYFDHWPQNSDHPLFSVKHDNRKTNEFPKENDGILGSIGADRQRGWAESTPRVALNMEQKSHWNSHGACKVSGVRALDGKSGQADSKPRAPPCTGEEIHWYSKGKQFYDNDSDTCCDKVEKIWSVMLWDDMIWQILVGPVMICYEKNMLWYGVNRYMMIWCYMIWYAARWHGMIWNDMRRYGTIWYDRIWCGIITYGMIWHDCVVIRIDMVWSNATWWEMVWHEGMCCDMVWYDAKCCVLCDNMMRYGVIWYDIT